MLSVEQVQTALAAIKARNAAMRRLIERRKLRSEGYEGKSYERPVFHVPGLDSVLADVEEEVDDLMSFYGL